VTHRTLADHVVDIAENSVKAGAKNVKVIIEETQDFFSFTVEDDGPGIEDPEKVFDPFYTTRDPSVRKVGLGLPFLKQAAELTGGYVRLLTSTGKGTRVTAWFNRRSVECQPVGNVGEAIATLLLSNPEVDWYVVRRKDGNGYEIDTKKLKELVDWDPKNPRFASWVFKFLEELEREIEGGGPDEW